MRSRTNGGMSPVRWVVGTLALLTFLRVWIGPFSLIQTAQAQIPDSGLQRKILIEEIKRTNQLLSEIKQVITSYTLNMPQKGADNKPGTRRVRTPRGG